MDGCAPQLTVWTCSQTSRGHITCPPSLAVHNDLSLGRLPDLSWRRCPGRPGIRWLDQICRDNSTPPADLWRRAVTLGRDTTVLDDCVLMMTTTMPLVFWHYWLGDRHLVCKNFCFKSPSVAVNVSRSIVQSTMSVWRVLAFPLRMILWGCSG